MSPVSCEIVSKGKGLECLSKALEELEGSRARVGIPGKNGARGGGAGNAMRGAEREFGSITRGIPERSFLRAPMMRDLVKKLERDGGAESMVKAIARGGGAGALEILGGAGAEVAREALRASGDDDGLAGAVGFDVKLKGGVA